MKWNAHMKKGDLQSETRKEEKGKKRVEMHNVKEMVTQCKKHAFYKGTQRNEYYTWPCISKESFP